MAVAAAALTLHSCGKTEKKSPMLNGMPDLILCQAQFRNETGVDGKVQRVAGAARMVLAYQSNGGFETELIEDKESNVFHKAIPYINHEGKEGILSIGGNDAYMKFWTRSGGKWISETLYKGEFGSSNNRLRDIEIGDVTGDGQDDIVLATHDQGVVLVLQYKENRWQPTELDRSPDTYVHEIELGDVDRDGIQEIFATPSAPNKYDGTIQPGLIPMYDYKNGKFIRTVVEDFGNRHAKEILCADLEDDGQMELYCALEATMKKVPIQGGSKMAVSGDSPALVKRYDFQQNGRIDIRTFLTLRDLKCRFLTIGETDGDPQKEMVISPMKTGVWVVDFANGKWNQLQIDRQSSGFEHATVVADIDNNGVDEIYVVAEEQRVLRRYTWTDSYYKTEDILPIGEGFITFGIMPGKIAAYKRMEEIRKTSPQKVQIAKQ